MTSLKDHTYLTLACEGRHQWNTRMIKYGYGLDQKCPIKMKPCHQSRIMQAIECDMWNKYGQWYNPSMEELWTINEVLSQSQETWLPPHQYSPLVSYISDMVRLTA